MIAKEYHFYYLDPNYLRRRMSKILGFNVVSNLYTFIQISIERKSPYLSLAIQNVLIPLVGTCGIIGNLFSIIIFRMPEMKSSSSITMISKYISIGDHPIILWVGW